MSSNSFPISRKIPPYPYIYISSYWLSFSYPAYRVPLHQVQNTAGTGGDPKRRFPLSGSSDEVNLCLINYFTFTFTVMFYFHFYFKVSLLQSDSHFHCSSFTFTVPLSFSLLKFHFHFQDQLNYLSLIETFKVHLHLSIATLPAWMMGQIFIMSHQTLKSKLHNRIAKWF